MSEMHQFRNAIERARVSGEVDGVMSLLAEDVVFRSPVVYAPYEGRADVEPLLRAVVQVFDDFRFARQIGEPDSSDHALVFHARIDDRGLTPAIAPVLSQPGLLSCLVGCR
jgi:hypothetical protein